MSIEKDVILPFLKAWLSWAENGGIDEEPFSNTCGTCVSLYEYVRKNHKEIEDFTVNFRYHMLLQGRTYPFGGKDVYNHEAYDGVIHLNPERLAWVKDRISDCEQSQL